MVDISAQMHVIDHNVGKIDKAAAIAFIDSCHTLFFYAAFVPKWYVCAVFHNSSLR